MRVCEQREMGAAFGDLLFSLTRTKPDVLAVAGDDQERNQNERG
jgi:hypothetical protein